MLAPMSFSTRRWSILTAVTLCAALACTPDLPTRPDTDGTNRWAARVVDRRRCPWREPAFLLAATGGAQSRDIPGNRRSGDAERAASAGL